MCFLWPLLKLQQVTLKLKNYIIKICGGLKFFLRHLFYLRLIEMNVLVCSKLLLKFNLDKAPTWGAKLLRSWVRFPQSPERFYYISVPQLCVLNQVPWRGAILLIFLSWAAWGKTICRYLTKKSLCWFSKGFKHEIFNACRHKHEKIRRSW